MLPSKENSNIIKETIRKSKENGDFYNKHIIIFGCTLYANDIIDVVCKYYNVSKQDVTGKKKNKEVVDPRQMCIYLITELTDLPLTSIGGYFSGRDHTTIMHSRDKIADQARINTRTKTAINELKNIILKK